MKSISKPKSKKLKRFDNSLLKEDAKILFTENPESSENNREIFGESFKEFGQRTGLIIIRNSKPTEDDIDYPKGTRCIIKNNTTLIYELKENKWIRIFDFDSLVTAKILCPLGPDGLIPSENLSLEALEFKGRWDPNKNEPELRDGVGTLGDTYFALNSKSFDFGHGLVPVYKNGAVIYNGEKWFTFNSSYARSVNEINPDEHGNVNLDAKLIPYNKENVERSLENIEDYDIVIKNQEELDEYAEDLYHGASDDNIINPKFLKREIIENAPITSKILNDDFKDFSSASHEETSDEILDLSKLNNYRLKESEKLKLRDEFDQEEDVNILSIYFDEEFILNMKNFNNLDSGNDSDKNLLNDFKNEFGNDFYYNPDFLALILDNLYLLPKGLNLNYGMLDQITEGGSSSSTDAPPPIAM